MEQSSAAIATDSVIWYEQVRVTEDLTEPVDLREYVRNGSSGHCLVSFAPSLIYWLKKQ